MPSLGGSRRRHTKHSSSSSPPKKTAPPPPISISTSHSSENTTATTTPKYDAYSSGLRPPKRPALANRADRPCSGYKESRAMGLLEKENLNVFDFMQNEEPEFSEPTDEDCSDRSSRSPPSKESSPRMTDCSQRSPRYSDLEVRAIQDGVQRAWGRASLHSDSGISVRSHSPDQDSPIMKDKLPMEPEIPMIEESGYENDEPGPDLLPISPSNDHPRTGFSHRHWPSGDTTQSCGPEAYQMHLPQFIAQRPVSHDEEMPEMHSKPIQSMIHLRSRRNSTAAPPPKSGYELLAANISAKDDTVLKPIYRKFEILNNRMLLYLQDEIAQMEEDLKELDTAIAMEDQDFGHGGPASRRSEAKLPSQLQWHRLDLLGRSFAKVEQYNRALSSYTNLTKSISPASQTDISTYRQWIADHAPIADSETDFLNHESDLLSISQPAPSPASTSHALHSQTASASALHPTSISDLAAARSRRRELETPVIVLSFALVSTTIVFQVVPNILARLIISLLMGVAALGILRPDALCSWEGLREWRSVVGGYIGVMSVLSIVVG